MRHNPASLGPVLGQALFHSAGADEEVTQAQNARILVVNLGPTNESGVVQVTLTR
jgi:hypothetical protein